MSNDKWDYSVFATSTYINCPSHAPWAFLATRSRSNNTMMLKICDISPARRNRFILMVNCSTIDIWPSPLFYCYQTQIQSNQMCIQRYIGISSVVNWLNIRCLLLCCWLAQNKATKMTGCRSCPIGNELTNPDLNWYSYLRIETKVFKWILS